MLVKELHILPTDNTPEFIFNPEGIIKIRGRGLFGDRTDDSEQITNWIDAYLNNPSEITYVIIAFDYLNSFSTMIIIPILIKISQVVLQSKKLDIRWYYEQDDDDILARGKYISSAFDLPIEFMVTNNITGC